jgi:hypothetical protein
MEHRIPNNAPERKVMRSNAKKLRGVIKTEIQMKANIVTKDDKEHAFTFRFDAPTYNLMLGMLKTGAPVWFGLQKDFDDAEESPHD